MKHGEERRPDTNNPAVSGLVYLIFVKVGGEGCRWRGEEREGEGRWEKDREEKGEGKRWKGDWKRVRGREITKNNSEHERAACNLSARNTPAWGRKQGHISPEECWTKMALERNLTKSKWLRYLLLSETASWFQGKPSLSKTLCCYLTRAMLQIPHTKTVKTHHIFTERNPEIKVKWLQFCKFYTHSFHFSRISLSEEECTHLSSS